MAYKIKPAQFTVHMDTAIVPVIVVTGNVQVPIVLRNLHRTSKRATPVIHILILDAKTCQLHRLSTKLARVLPVIPRTTGRMMVRWITRILLYYN